MSGLTESIRLFLKKLMLLQYGEDGKVAAYIRFPLRIPSSWLYRFFYASQPIVPNKIVFDNYMGKGYGCNPRYVAADLLSQAEHDEMASAILVTTSMELAEKVSAYTDEFIKELSRGEIIQKSLDNYGHILVAENMEDAIDAANEIASEHLEIMTENPFEVMTKIRNAGAIFIGKYSSEPLGDYFAGPNHVLPTNGTAKFFSPLSVDDFIKKSSIISYSRDALEKIHTDIEQFAEAEYLTAHANSIKVRFDGKDE